MSQSVTYRDDDTYDCRRCDLLLHLFDQIWIILQKIADDKKGSRNMMLFRAARIEGYCHFVTTVKSQINHFLISVSGIVGIIFF